MVFFDLTRPTLWARSYLAPAHPTGYTRLLLLRHRRVAHSSSTVREPHLRSRIRAIWLFPSLHFIRVESGSSRLVSFEAAGGRSSGTRVRRWEFARTRSPWSGTPRTVTCEIRGATQIMSWILPNGTQSAGVPSTSRFRVFRQAVPAPVIPVHVA